jgi:hypothetical protein
MVNPGEMVDPTSHGVASTGRDRRDWEHSTAAGDCVTIVRSDISSAQRNETVKSKRSGGTKR